MTKKPENAADKKQDSAPHAGVLDDKRVNIGLKEKIHAQAKIISTLKKIYHFQELFPYIYYRKLKKAL